MDLGSVLKGILGDLSRWKSMLCGLFELPAFYFYILFFYKLAKGLQLILQLIIIID